MALGVGQRCEIAFFFAFAEAPIRIGFWPIGVPSKRTRADKDNYPEPSARARREPAQAQEGKLQPAELLRPAKAFRPMLAP